MTIDDEQRVRDLARRIEEQTLARDPGVRINDEVRRGMRIGAVWFLGLSDAEREAAGLLGPYADPSRTGTT